MKGADKHISEPIEAWCLVMPKTSAKAIMARAVAGEIGSDAVATVDTVASRTGMGTSPLEPGTTSVGLLALTADEVVLVNGRRGMLKPVANGLAGRAPRTALVDVELGKGKLTAPLRLEWADGSSWEADVPRGEAKRARGLLDRLAG